MAQLSRWEKSRFENQAYEYLLMQRERETSELNKDLQGNLGYYGNYSLQDLQRMVDRIKDLIEMHMTNLKVQPLDKGSKIQIGKLRKQLSLIMPFLETKKEEFAINEIESDSKPINYDKQ